MGATEPRGADAAAALKRLNVCRGGFTYDAAAAILGINLNPSSESGGSGVSAPPPLTGEAGRGHMTASQPPPNSGEERNT